MSTPEIIDPYDITVRSNDLGRRRLTEKLVSVARAAERALRRPPARPRARHRPRKGAEQLDLDFFTKSSALFGEKGGIADALVGSMLIVAMATIMAVPIAILVAIYIAEYAGPKAASFFRVMLDVLNGVPAILVGIFIYGLLVVGHGQSAIYGAMALAILMIPMVARATQEVLELVPRHLREASLALGVPRWRTVYSIVLPTAIGGMLTGIVIAVARVAGETAPLIFTSSIVTSQGVSVDVHEALATLPVRIFTLSESPSPGRPGGRLGRRARADRLRARDEHPRQVLRGAEAQEPRGHLASVRPAPVRIDNVRYDRVDEQGPAARRLLHADRRPDALGRAGGRARDALQGARRPPPGEDPQHARAGRGRGDLRLRLHRAARPQAGDGLLPPQAAHRHRAAPAREARKLRVLPPCRRRLDRLGDVVAAPVALARSRASVPPTRPPARRRGVRRLRARLRRLRRDHGRRRRRTRSATLGVALVVRARDHGDDLRDRPRLRRPLQPGGDARLRAHPSLPLAAGAPLYWGAQLLGALAAALLLRASLGNVAARSARRCPSGRRRAAVRSTRPC